MNEDKAIPTIGFIDIAGASSLPEVIAAQEEREGRFRSAFAPITAGVVNTSSEQTVRTEVRVKERVTDMH